MQETEQAKPVSRKEIFLTFLSFGFLSFGGPVAHLALFERELVGRRGWLSHEHFLNLLSAINLVPGPNSTEMAFHIGMVKGGFWGCILGGVGFTAPAVFISMVLAAIYVFVGTVPAIQGVFVGVKPIVLVLILSAGFRLGKKAIDNRAMGILFGIAMLVVGLTLPSLAGWLVIAPLPVPDLALLLATGMVYTVYRQRHQTPAVLAIFVPVFGVVAQIVSTMKPSLLDLFARFFLIGATLFGSGFVLASYMERSFVTDAGWLTPRQLVDTLAIGQSTPGPVLSTSAAAGYVMTVTPDNVMSGVPGAIVSAVGVFTPAFFIVLILGRAIPYLQRHPAALDFLKGVNAGVIALLVGTFINLASGTLVRTPDHSVDWLSIGVIIVAFIGMERRNWSPLVLIFIGAGIGLLRMALNLT